MCLEDHSSSMSPRRLAVDKILGQDTLLIHDGIETSHIWWPIEGNWFIVPVCWRWVKFVAGHDQLIDTLCMGLCEQKNVISPVDGAKRYCTNQFNNFVETGN